MPVPGFGSLQPELIGPVLDLWTFYVDLQLAYQQTELKRPGDHVTIKHGLPNSWADGVSTLVGHDAIDFEITLVGIDKCRNQAELLIKHVPPDKLSINVPAEWMKEPVADTPNNWVQVKKKDGKYIAAVGKETFDVAATVNVKTGEILSVKMNNPYEILEKECSDSALMNCGSPKRLKNFRKIEINLSQ